MNLLVRATVLVLAAAWVGSAAPAGASSAVSPLPASDYSTRALCGEPLPGSASCLALELVPRTAAARARTHPLGMTRVRPASEPTAAEGGYGYRPQDLHAGYQLPTEQLEAATHPQTIAIVDAYDDVNAEADLGVYDQEFHLPACTHENGCFTKLNQNGQVSPLPTSSTTEAKGWAGEIATDVEMAHAICQNCRILLVEAVSASNSDLDTAENTAVAKGATEISDSWGGPESLGESTAAFEHPGIVITAAAGDTGYLDWNNKESAERGSADFPATSPEVVAVGGTRLILNEQGSWLAESVWNGDGATGGGCSTIYPAHAWQPSAAVGCGSNRAVADVSADGDPYTGVAVYDSTPNPSSGNSVGWGTIGGTSVASPIVASIFALSGGAHGVAQPAETLYANLATTGALRDVITGSNGSCGQPFNAVTGNSGCTIAEESTSCGNTAICDARSGYDGPSGVGSPIGLAAFQPTSAQHSGKSESESETKKPPTKEGETEKTGGAPNPSGPEPSPANPVIPGGSGTPSTPPNPTAASSTARPILTNLTLTLSAIAALNHGAPIQSQIAFAFTLDLPATVRITLAKRVKVRGHLRWKALPGSFTISANAGLDRARFRSHRKLVPGRYLLTCAPAHGTAQTLQLVLG